MVRMEGAPGVSQPEMDRIVIRASSELRSISGVQNVAAHVGRAVTGDQIVGINSAELWVSIEPGADYDATLAAIQETVTGYPGLDHEVRTYLQQTLNQPQASTQGFYTLRVYGEDHAVLRDEVQKVQQTLAGIDGVVASQAVLPLEEPTLEIEVDLSAAQRFGVKPGDVRRAASTLLSGLQVGSLFEEQKIFDVVVWSKPEARQSLSDIRDLLIDTPGGGHVRLGEVADVRISPVPTVIHREAVSPYLDVIFKTRGRSVNAVLGDIEATMQNYPFPLEYHAEIQRDYLQQQKTQQGIVVSGVLAAIGILLLLQAAYESWRMAIAGMLILPATVAGSLWIAALGGNAISTASLFGLFAVVGMGVRSSILLVKHYHRLEKNGSPFGPELVLHGAKERLVPLLASTIATSLALLPFVIFGNRPGHEIVATTVLIVLGGLITSTLVNIFVLPALYLRFGASREAELGFISVPTAGEA